MSATLREHNARALDRILLEHYGGKVGRGLAVRLSQRRDNPRRAESLFTTVLTGHTGDGESFAETGHNAGANISLL
jgi:hypothetical protein